MKYGTNLDFPTVTGLFDLSHSIAAPLFSGIRYPWEVLSGINGFIASLELPEDEYDNPAPLVFISKRASVAPSAEIKAPVVICAGAEIRHCAFIRGSVIIGEGAVVGNSTELKNCILFDKVQAPHFNYVGDSLLGYEAHLGAGAVTSNVKSDKSEVSVAFDGLKLRTGRRKFGAAIGDHVEIGCGAVLCPGCVVGRGTTIYPQLTVRGYVPPGVILKSDGRPTRKREL